MTSKKLSNKNRRTLGDANFVRHNFLCDELYPENSYCPVNYSYDKHNFTHRARLAVNFLD